MLTEADLSPQARADQRIVRDFRRFSWFSDGWTARTPGSPDVIGDVRYSLRTDAFQPVWGVRFHHDADQATEWIDRTDKRDITLALVWSEVVGTHPAYRPLTLLAAESVGSSGKEGE
jgi:hypothetical protein